MNIPLINTSAYLDFVIVFTDSAIICFIYKLILPIS